MESSSCWAKVSKYIPFLISSVCGSEMNYSGIRSLASFYSGYGFLLRIGLYEDVYGLEMGSDYERRGLIRTLDERFIMGKKWCCGSVTFLYRSCSRFADPYKRLPDPDPALFVNGSQDANQK
jgi:hypothetical protein